MDSIRSVFEYVKKVDWSSCPNQVTGESLTRKTLANLFAVIERWRLPVGIIFLSPQDVMSFKALHDLDVFTVPSPSLPLLQETEGIRFIENAWGADVYESGEIPQGEVIATTVPKFLPDALAEGHGVARLELGVSGTI